MGRPSTQDAPGVPAASPDPAGNTGYAEPKPADKHQARMPGAKETPDSEEGGLDHEPDPKT